MVLLYSQGAKIQVPTETKLENFICLFEKIYRLNVCIIGLLIIQAVLRRRHVRAY